MWLHMFFRLYLSWQCAHISLQLLIQPWICAPGTHYSRVDRGSVEYEVCVILLYTWPVLEIEPQTFWSWVHRPVHLATCSHYYTLLMLLPSWSIKVSIAAQKFATSTLMTAPLKVVTIECIEHDVTCLNERVFIKTVNHLLTNCSQSTLLAIVCRLSLLVLNTS